LRPLGALLPGFDGGRKATMDLGGARRTGHFKAAEFVDSAVLSRVMIRSL
jgi:hypothetical protein